MVLLDLTGKSHFYLTFFIKFPLTLGSLVFATIYRAGKSTLLKLLTGENEPTMGKVNRNGRLRIGYFAQHHLDQLDLDLSPVAFLAQKFPGRSEQEYRQHLGGFGITGMTGLQTLKTLSGGQKSRVTFALLSLQR